MFGEVIDALHQAREAGMDVSPQAWEMETRMIAHLESCWREPDAGIWEVRGKLRRFTHSRAMIWAAFDRAIRKAEQCGADVPLARWRETRAAIHAEVLAHGFDADLNSFTRDFESKDLDASLLLLPQIGFLPADDARIRGTIEAIGARLSRHGLIDRLGTTQEGAFIACNFWYADALLLMERRDEAQALFARLLRLRNDVGLVSEEFDPDTETLMGNFPLAWSHVAMVNTALNLEHADGPAMSRSGARARAGAGA